jgi:hypothetical protein
MLSMSKGRCSLGVSDRQIDVRKVIWLGTSNIGHDLVFDHHNMRQNPDELMSREEYVELMGLLRPRVSERLGVRANSIVLITYMLICGIGISTVTSNNRSSVRSFLAGREACHRFRSTLFAGWGPD